MVYGIVVNKKGKLLLRADFKTEIGILTVDELKLLPVVKINNKYVEEAKEKVNARKKKPMAVSKKIYAILKDIFFGGEDKYGLEETEWDIQPEQHKEKSLLSRFW